MDGEDIIMRWANYSSEAQILTIDKTDAITEIYRSNVIEEELERLILGGDKWKIEVSPFEIITIGVKKK
jgi:alpha-mannosidase